MGDAHPKPTYRLNGQMLLLEGNNAVPCYHHNLGFIFFRFQIPHTGLHTMAVFGLFFTGGSTALFGVLEYLTTKENPKGRDIAYLALAFTLRTGQALGNTAYSTASLTILSVCFTETATTVMVGWPLFLQSFQHQLVFVIIQHF